jgi:outer membrane cobalamin receptor
MKAVLLFVFLFLSALAWSQTVSGRVTDSDNNPLPGANVYIQNTFSGGSTDTNGVFSFFYEEGDSLNLIVEFLGYEKVITPLHSIDENQSLNVVLKESFNLLSAVTITAGTYGSGKVESTVVMSSLDVVTTAGSLGDINAAMRSLPGTSNNGESGKLFVHGGEGTETGTYIDGIYVHQPYTTSAPNMAVRGRFNPFMFSGTSFSTGGYSAEFGQALSSILSLNTNDMPVEDQLDFSIMTIGGDVSGTKKWEAGAITTSFNYMNLQPYMSVVPQNYEWNQEPVAYGGSLNFRQKTKYSGMFKLYASADQSNLSPDEVGIDGSGEEVNINVKNTNQFTNANWRGIIAKNLFMKVGGSFTYNLDNYQEGNKFFDQKLLGNHIKATLKYRINEKISLRSGAENVFTSFEQSYSYVEATWDSSSTYHDNVSAVFLEGQAYTSARFLFNIGLRLEYASYLKQSTLSPRISMAYQLAEKTSLSIAYGVFYQNPIPEQMNQRPFLKNEQAQHFILSFEKQFKGRLLRSEVYYKNYNDLVKYNNPFTNDGSGYAYGLDLFYKDNISIKNGSFWISYSFLQSERDFRYYPHAARPTFTVTHSLSLVYKHWISSWRSYVGAAFRYASPRVYNDLNSDEFNAAKLPSNASLDLNWSYLHKQNIIFYASITNLLGFENVYGYQYSPIPDDTGYYSNTAILPPAKRFFFIGCFITLTKKGEANQLDKINF